MPVSDVVKTALEEGYADVMITLGVEKNHEDEVARLKGVGSGTTAEDVAGW
jgi:hypothetical protein